VKNAFVAERESAPSVGAIIPAHNAQAYLREAIESILEQSRPVLDCVVVDDGSTDGTAALAEEYGPPVRVLRQENRGVAAARNRGAAEVEGALLAFLDADDRWKPDRLKLQLEALGRSAQAEAAVCATCVVDAHRSPLGFIHPDSDATVEDLLLCRATVVSTSSNLLILRSAFEAVGGFDDRLSTSADWALTFRLLERGRLIVLREPLVEYRRHGSNMSADVGRFERDMLAAYDMVFADPPAGVRPLRRRAYASLHRVIAGSYFVDRDFGHFAKHAARSVGTHPSTLPYFLTMPLRRARRWAYGRGDPLR
jgi:glycosyltransferase involved in cell wall biosynthesis